MILATKYETRFPANCVLRSLSCHAFAKGLSFIREPRIVGNRQMSATETIELGSQGVRKTLSHYSPTEAIFEYIWNGYDARAKNVHVSTKVAVEGWDVLESITVSDDGEGIPYSELKLKFKPFLESAKSKINTAQGRYRKSDVQGKEGRGRLTFFKFAQSASWKTRFTAVDHVEEYEIAISSDNLQNYNATEPTAVNATTGTDVTFHRIDPDFGVPFVKNKLLDELRGEFGWFLKLNEAKGFTLTLNGVPIDYKSAIVSEEKLEIVHEPTRTRFAVEFVQWTEKVPDYSKFYYLDEQGFERCKRNTNFNNKGDGFNHSVFVKSRFFDDWTLAPTESDGELNFNGEREVLTFLNDELTKLLRRQRKKVLRRVADEMIESYEKERVFPRFSRSIYDKQRFEDLKEVIRTVYEADPRVFWQLNLQQKKTMVGFLNLLLDSDERERVLTLLEEVIQLDEEEQRSLISLLQTTELNQIIRTMTLIKGRFEAVDLIKRLVFDKELKTNEVPDLQSVIEAHYWLFGEEYHLVTAAEPSIEEALRRLTYILTGDETKIIMNHPHKEKEMDIFAVREIVHAQRLESIIVELKHPSVILGNKELEQVKRYMRAIREEPLFNGGNRDWRFILVGNKYNSEIEDELRDKQHHGEPSLVFNVDNAKIYVKTWDEIFTEFRCKHNFLNAHLQLKLQNMPPRKDKEAIKVELLGNPARMAGEITTDIPNGEIQIGIHMA